MLPAFFTRIQTLLTTGQPKNYAGSDMAKADLAALGRTIEILDNANRSPTGWKPAPPLMTHQMHQAMQNAIDSGQPVWPAILNVMPNPPADGRTLTVNDTV